MGEWRHRIRGTDRFRRDEHGSMSIAAAIMIPALIVMIGLVYDANGKVAAARDANAAAVAAARAGGDAASANVTAGTSPGHVAAATARRSLAGQGITGSVTVSGRTLTVHTTVTYQTVFLSLAGIDQLAGHGDATARIAPVTP
jgi:Flp pilus assembly protein TadG